MMAKKFAFQTLQCSATTIFWSISAFVSVEMRWRCDWLSHFHFHTFNFTLSISFLHFHTLKYVGAFWIIVGTIFGREEMMVGLAFTLSLSHIYFHTFTFIPSLSHFEVRWCILDNCRDYIWSRGDDGGTGFHTFTFTHLLSHFHFHSFTFTLWSTLVHSG